MSACDIVQERSLNEQWGVLADGSMDGGDYRGDGGSSEFSNWACLEHEFSSDVWGDMVEHCKNPESPS